MIINGEKAMGLLVQAVEERGRDFIYEPVVRKGVHGACVYQDQGTPSCGVGLALHKAGVAIEVLAAMDQVEDTSINVVTPELEAGGTTLTDKAVDVFLRFQEHQDLQLPWGEALDHAAGVLA